MSESAWLLERLPAGHHGLSPDLVGENQRARLTAAAAESLAEHGYGAITVTGVVKRAGVSTSTFYKRSTISGTASPPAWPACWGAPGRIATARRGRSSSPAHSPWSRCAPGPRAPSACPASPRR